MMRKWKATKHRILSTPFSQNNSWHRRSLSPSLSLFYKTNVFTIRLIRFSRGFVYKNQLKIRSLPCVRPLCVAALLTATVRLNLLVGDGQLLDYCPSHIAVRWASLRNKHLARQFHWRISIDWLSTAKLVVMMQTELLLVFDFIPIKLLSTAG